VGYKSWLFIDGVDFDFCMNLNIHGYKVRRLNFCNLIHELGDIKLINFFGRKLVCSNHNYIRRYYMSRNDHYIFDLYSKYFPDYCQMIIDGLKGQARNILFFENNKFKKLVFMKYGFQDYKNNVRGECKWK
jgi:rhamnosyltransferase